MAKQVKKYFIDITIDNLDRIMTLEYLVYLFMPKIKGVDYVGR